ncbi:hypothetical protein L6164_027071 [Bauhinia variegata]|uniref:Uncharacterized protein n=1 Tax=Bauhinia variegata TaxID=167791 RepID=A0ACB9LTJ3_BAUVA|nr:hypothetical protein L6164_027071 [Bauhinia variegata]
MGSAIIPIHSSWHSTEIETLKVHYFATHQRVFFPNSKRSKLFPIKSSTRPGNGNSSAMKKDLAVEIDPDSAADLHATSTPNQALSRRFSRGLVFNLGSKGSWDAAEVGSAVVKRFIGDDEERWFMWYHGRSKRESSDSIGLAVSSNGVQWTRGAKNASSCGDVGCVMNCSEKWWAFDTKGIRPSEVVIMSSPMYSSVQWLYYTGYTSQEVDLSGVSYIQHGLLAVADVVPRDPSYGSSREHTSKTAGNQKDRIFKSFPGLACSQDGRHWARIEGDNHSGALLDVGTDKDWDSLFIAAPKVVVHSSDDLRMYYYSFDAENDHFALGMARSRDGIRWVKLGKIMGGGSVGSFDELGVRNASVVRSHQGGNYLMAYEGVAADGRTSIGVAVSSDGLKNWKRVQEEPILEPLEDDGWDNRGVGSPCLVHIRKKTDEWRLYYVGVGNDGRTGIGMAVSEGSDITTFRRWEGI